MERAASVTLRNNVVTPHDKTPGFRSIASGIHEEQMEVGGGGEKKKYTICDIRPKNKSVESKRAVLFHTASRNTYVCKEASYAKTLKVSQAARVRKGMGEGGSS